MRNRDLIAYFKPVRSRSSQPDAVELLDWTGQATSAPSDRVRLSLRLTLSAGLYRLYLRTQAQAFDMATASLEMTRVPDGKRVLLGPWDLDHVHNVMAMPMAKVFVNERLVGGMWFAMPGPEEIAQGRLFADIGFEAEQGENEVVLELIERDRFRMGWDRLEFIEVRKDDRRHVPLEPAGEVRPRLFVSASEAADVRQRWEDDREFAALGDSLRLDELVMLTDNSQGTLSLAIIYYALTGDAEIGERARAAVMELARAKTWSGRPDPLLMGGENDRGISLRLFHAALGWEHLQPLLTTEERVLLLGKAAEYVQKIYDFTVLQRAYMGCPAIDPHSLGSWNGAAIACMAFCEDLPIARHALPFFHGLFVDSLHLFPESGKAAWATYFPFHLVVYLAAAHTFGGPRKELSSSRFLDHLGQALLACFESPNTQELQRGLRTREHRFLTAFLHRFHPTPGIDAIYRTFVARERLTAGDLSLGIFDLLYAPELEGEQAEMPDEPLFAAEVGEIIVKSRAKPTVAVAMSAGAKAGRLASFKLMPQNREFAPSMGAFEVTVDGAPVLCNLNISTYGINSALNNAMCLESGGGVTNGQYLNGAVRPEQGSTVRRYFCGQRFVYAHVIVTEALDPALEVESAERVFVFDRDGGAVVIEDSFCASRPLQFATHLHCSGSARELEKGVYRVTGGQAELIAGIKGGSKGLGNEERSELYVRVLGGAGDWRVTVEEPTWIPGYIYGLNYTGSEELKDAKYPRYTRWRLEADERSAGGRLRYAIAPDADSLSVRGEEVLFPNGGMMLGRATHQALEVSCECECLLWDATRQSVVAMGAVSLKHSEAMLKVSAPVDIEYRAADRAGVIYGLAEYECETRGFRDVEWNGVAEQNRPTHARYRAVISAALMQSRAGEGI